MAGLAESLFPRSSKLGHLSGYHPRALLGAGLDVASLPGRAYASLGRMEDESYLDALGRTGPRYVVSQGEGDEMADAILRDPLTPVGFGVGAAIKGLRPILGLGADLGANAAGMAADQYATTGSVNGGEIGAGAGMGALLGLGGMAKGGKRSMISPEERDANFRNWFGDSKVVDDAGKPLVVYHGSINGEVPSDFGKKDIAYFTPSKDIANVYGRNKAIGDFYVKLENPIHAYSPDDINNLLPDEMKAKNAEYSWNVLQDKDLPDIYENSDAIEYLRDELGYDGVIVYDDKYTVPNSGGRLETHKSIASFYPENIKSATGNRGTFDPSDPNITHFAGSASAPSRNRTTTRLERQAAQVAYDKYGRPREESAGLPVSTFQGLGSLLSSPSDTYYTRGGR